MGAVQAQILRPAQGTRMALTQASVSATSTSFKSRQGATLLFLLLFPISQALPTTEGQNWLARSTCVLDALAHGGIVDSEKFNQCMDCWRRSSDESLQAATACLTSLPQFCKEDTAEDGAAGPILCVEMSKIIQLDGEVQNFVRRRRSPTSLTGGGISFGSGFSLGSGLGLAGLGTAVNAATANLFAGLGLAALTG